MTKQKLPTQSLISIVAFRKLPERYVKRFTGKDYFIAEMDKDYGFRSILMFKVYNINCGDIWIGVFTGEAPGNARLIFGERKFLYLFVHRGLTENTRQFWNECHEEVKRLQHQERVSQTPIKVSEMLVLFVLHNISWDGSDEEINKKLAAVMDSVFRSNIFPDSKSNSCKTLNTDQGTEEAVLQDLDRDSIIIESISANRVSRDSEYKEVIRLSGYERLSRFMFSEIWKELIVTRNIKNKFTYIAYVNIAAGKISSCSKFGTSFHMNDVPAGYIAAVKTKCSSDRGIERLSIDIISMAVHPQVRQFGIGKFLMRQLLMDANLPVDCIVPETCTEMLMLMNSAGFGRGTLIRGSESSVIDEDCFMYQAEDPSKLANKLLQ